MARLSFCSFVFCPPQSTNANWESEGPVATRCGFRGCFGNGHVSFETKNCRVFYLIYHQVRESAVICHSGCFALTCGKTEWCIGKYSSLLFRKSLFTRRLLSHFRVVIEIHCRKYYIPNVKRLKMAKWNFKFQNYFKQIACLCSINSHFAKTLINFSWNMCEFFHSKRKERIIRIIGRKYTYNFRDT